MSAPAPHHGRSVGAHLSMDTAQQQAYRTWLLHAESCHGCRAADKPATGCDTGRDLWRTYRAARIAPDKGAPS
jgi:hypothetical protein